MWWSANVRQRRGDRHEQPVLARKLLVAMRLRSSAGNGTRLDPVLQHNYIRGFRPVLRLWDVWGSDADYGISIVYVTPASVRGKLG